MDAGPNRRNPKPPKLHTTPKPRRMMQHSRSKNTRGVPHQPKGQRQDSPPAIRAPADSISGPHAAEPCGDQRCDQSVPPVIRLLDGPLLLTEEEIQKWQPRTQAGGQQLPGLQDSRLLLYGLVGVLRRDWPATTRYAEHRPLFQANPVHSEPCSADLAPQTGAHQDVISKFRFKRRLKLHCSNPTEDEHRTIHPVPVIDRWVGDHIRLVPFQFRQVETNDGFAVLPTIRRRSTLSGSARGPSPPADVMARDKVK